jgi:hypothetical protein
MATQNPLNPHSRSLVELLHAGGDELLRDDSTRLAERASGAGCDATIEVWPEMQHVGSLVPCWSGQVAIALGEACEALIADEALTTKSASAGMQLHALMNAWTKERINHARLFKLALDAGIQQRQLDLVESQANQIVAAISSLLMSPRLGLSAEQIIEGRIVAAEIFRSLPGAAQALVTPMPH